ncbi:hypothetical protein COU78_02560 [Candidatus Peregrinibacteria bacterium CG10_big_fil_rev_8_21_14_0_10_49_24]|nr:MAG: hypothetical protein COV83_02540 [Candidatus Peregrinibacteria bacterium CG11_big_fil_rev_8_21_14_0_20_49_14]PIR51019.1 MAG: hypothetical protein COU78_02560 [Candidatus Peregrinibacteria bacterium CG10_big_fil_rev_8_21_14_0_10_49_24]PJA67572.1 MAG: hypothetical protein CO157_04040 [Candidatus Peregrinibacteria bacterium CG_4_9_14_3_um_filter_49_12]
MQYIKLLPLAALVPALLLTACGGGNENTEVAPVSAGPSRGVPDDVPLYTEDSDAKRMNYEITDTEIVVIMETINGPLSPITYYRNLANAGWTMQQDSGNDGGTILATKKNRTLSVTFTALPGGAGTLIELRTTKLEE